MKKEIRIKGMNCNACKMIIEDVCSDFKEITSSHVDVKKGLLQIEYTKELSLESLFNEIENSGDFLVIK